MWDRSALRSTAVGVFATILAAILLIAALGGVAQAHVVFIHGRGYGVTPSPNASGRPMLRGQAQPLTFGGPQPPVVYHGGSLMLTSKLYLIFWEQKAGEFSSEYTEPIIQYAKDLGADESLTTDEFSVAEQYTNAKKEPITSKVTFGGDVFDTTTYPALDTAEGCVKAPCVTDSQIQTEILNEIKAQGWPTDLASAPEAQYLVYTPQGVATCELFEGKKECAPEAFCAYHSEIKKIGTEKRVAVYSDLPYAADCDSGQAPTGSDGNKDTDGTLDSEIHEIVESATDPAPETGYTDEHGEEVADKCTGAVVEERLKVYGNPLGGSFEKDTAFNQLINGHSYYTQQIWSNAPTQTPTSTKSGEAAGCVARIGPTPSFTAPATGQTGVAVEFNGSSSYDISEPISTYEWNYGDGSPPETTTGATPTHYFIAPGTYQVSLTVGDSSGSADASTQMLPITVTGNAIGLPTASIVSPAANQTYTVGQAVATSFSCTETVGGPGIQSCTDSSGATSPDTLDTSTAGPHTYTVTAVSRDGQRGTAAIQYTVTAQSANSGSGGTQQGSGSTQQGPAPSGSTSGTKPVSTSAKPAGLSKAQKLAQALKACKKKPKSRRASCERQARKTYGSKPKSKARNKKAKSHG